ncbi:MAG: hypothetical protein AVDCRST_MAG59-3803 [uncultured Thermomicrobiales bacterium]|jgi:hypothetical protein|uniref:Uncharacterized protein n=1 Tax=uncultured Thermomicrobiales bacterium TaxID=1645740 RepID=A0A6J4VEJ0_9BACT|nr:MAG: hypothetical protein AVDCRST_MAG59-3803 [uncultured Thermomicrobiales bacterium]
MPGSHTEHAALAAYGDNLHVSIQRLDRSAKRAAALLQTVDRDVDDPVWRAALLVECRGWRDLLDAVPAEPPLAARELHVQALRWFGCVANAGVSLAAAITSRDPALIRATTARLGHCAELGHACAQTAAHLAERFDEADPNGPVSTGGSPGPIRARSVASPEQHPPPSEPSSWAQMGIADRLGVVFLGLCLVVSVGLTTLCVVGRLLGFM